MSTPATAAKQSRLARILPILAWAPRYQRTWLRPDVIAGIKRLLKKDKDIAVILLECKELSPHAHAV